MRSWFNIKRPFSLRIFMRSGNVIEIDGVTDYTIRNEGDEISSLRVAQKPKASRRLLVSTIALTQIEAVVRVT